MRGAKVSSTMTPTDALSVLSRAEVEGQGRWKSLQGASLSMAGLLVLVLPLYLVDAGLRTGAAPAQVTRLLTIAGLILVVRYYFEFVWRCGELVRSARVMRPVQRITTVVLWIAGASCCAAIAELVAAVFTARRISYPWTKAMPDLYRAHLIGAGMGLALMLALATFSNPAFWWRRDRERGLAA